MIRDAKMLEMFWFLVEFLTFSLLRVKFSNFKRYLSIKLEFTDIFLVVLNIV